MRKVVIVVTTTVLLIAFMPTSCSNKERARFALAKADRLLEQHTDSALMLLKRDSDLIVNEGKAERMKFILLKTEAEDKLYIPHHSESAMIAVTEYYSRRGSYTLCIRAYYELGRIYHDMRLYGSALSAFDNALKIPITKDSIAYEYKAKAAEWIGYIYENRKLYHKSLEYYKRMLSYANCLQTSKSQVFALRDIGRSLSDMGNIKTSIIYYEKAVQTAKSLGLDEISDLVMIELASLYCDCGMYKKAQDILPKSFDGLVDEDKASLYFCWAYFHQCVGNLDSAIYYNKKGMIYGSVEDKQEASLDIARIYKEKGCTTNAIEYYEIHNKYEDTLSLMRTIENEDYINHIEENLNNERKNLALTKSRMHLIFIIFAIIMFFSIIILYSIKAYKKRKLYYEKQRERARIYWEKTHLDDLENILRHEEEIKQLKEKLSLSDYVQTDLLGKLKIAEENLVKKNKQMLFEQKSIEQRIAELEHSSAYQLFHNSKCKPNNKDFKNLETSLNRAYNGFTFRLRELYPIIQIDEIQICCLVKIGLKSKEICNIMHFQANVLSMKRLRLYQKFFNKKGSATEFDAFIRDF